MAARRLIVIMLALLVISSVAAALVPVDARRGADESTTTTSPARPAGELIVRSIDAADERPATIGLAVGDQLALTVSSQRPDEVEIAGLGELRDVDPDAPARFDLLPFEAGTYPVRLVEAGRTIGRLEVAAPGALRPGDDDGPAEAQPGDSPGAAGSSDSDSPGSSTEGSTAGARSAS